MCIFNTLLFAYLKYSVRKKSQEKKLVVLHGWNILYIKSLLCKLSLPLGVQPLVVTCDHQRAAEHGGCQRHGMGNGWQWRHCCPRGSGTAVGWWSSRASGARLRLVQVGSNHPTNRLTDSDHQRQGTGLLLAPRC